MPRSHTISRPTKVFGLRLTCKVAVQSLASGWRARGYGMGFGVGIAMGPATVGTVGYEGRLDYTAIGCVVNLASRLCASADDAQILVDAVIAERVKDRVALVPLGRRIIKGYDHALQVFAVAHGDAAIRYPDCQL